MAKLVNRYASALLQFAQERGQLNSLYQQARAMLHCGRQMPGDASPELIAFLKFALQKEVNPVLQRFVEMARDHLGIVAVEVASAVELTPEQQQRLTEKIAKLSGKQVELTTKVDETLLGGLRIIIGETVIDSTIKTQLQAMKKSVYKGVYIAQ